VSIQRSTAVELSGTVLASLAVALVLFIAGLLIARGLGSTELSKLISDTLLKSSVLVCGLTIALLSFFWQKQIEDVDRQLTSGNNTLVNIDVFISQYANAIESARLDNDLPGGFPQLLAACQGMYLSCSARRMNTGSLTVGNLMSIVDYFGSPYLEKVTVDTNALINQHDLIKRTITSKQIESIGTEDSWISESHQAIRHNGGDEGKIRTVTGEA
jgi:hypothetical protein